MSTQVALSKNHPFMVAWEKYVSTPEYTNSLKWALAETYDDGRLISPENRRTHAEGAIWLAFSKGLELAASPAHPEKRDELIGKVVRVDNPQFTGFGVAQYDSGERKRMIGVKLENGNTWKYDAETVRLATPEEIKQAPRVVQAWAAPPQSGKEGQ